MDKLQLNKQIYSIYFNVKINEDRLPTYYPLKYTPNRTMFEEISLSDFEFELMQGYISNNMLEDLQGLNSYLIGKLGRMQQSTTKDQHILDRLRFIKEQIK